MSRPLELALIVSARFGLLLGICLWLGFAAAALLLAPVVQRSVEPAQAGPVLRAFGRRVDLALLLSLLLVALALGARVALDRAAPPTSLLAPLGIMGLGRLATVLVGRLRGPEAATLPLTGEACLALYALFAVS